MKKWKGEQNFTFHFVEESETSTLNALMFTYILFGVNLIKSFNKALRIRQ